MKLAADFTSPRTAAEPTGHERKARSSTYRLLAALLAGVPSPELLALVQGLKVSAENAYDPEGCAEEHDAPPFGETIADNSMIPSWTALGEAATGIDRDALEREYWDLFIGIGRGELVPYLSYYRTGFLMEKPLADLRVQLSRFGFSRADGVSEPEDHISAIFELMAELIDNGGAHASERQFFERFVESWAPRFFADLRRAEYARFYAAIGQLGMSFLVIERRYFELST